MIVIVALALVFAAFMAGWRSRGADRPHPALWHEFKDLSDPEVMLRYQDARRDWVQRVQHREPQR